MEKVQQQRIHKHYLLLKTKRNDISWVVRINHCHLVRIMRIISTFIQNLLYHSHLTCIWADHHVGTRSRRWWQSDSEEKTRKHCSKPLELFKETFSSHVSGNKTAHFWLHIWTFYCCVGGKNKAGYFCKMLGHFPTVFAATNTYFWRDVHTFTSCVAARKKRTLLMRWRENTRFFWDKMSQFQSRDSDNTSPKTVQKHCSCELHYEEM